MPLIPFFQEELVLGNTGRYEDEQVVADRLASEGMRVDDIDLAPFKAKADAVYAEAPLAQPWNAELMQQVMGQ